MLARCPEKLARESLVKERSATIRMSPCQLGRELQARSQICSLTLVSRPPARCVSARAGQLPDVGNDRAGRPTRSGGRTHLIGSAVYHLQSFACGGRLRLRSSGWSPASDEFVVRAGPTGWRLRGRWSARRARPRKGGVTTRDAALGREILWDAAALRLPARDLKALERGVVEEEVLVRHGAPCSCTATSRRALS